MLGRGWFRNPLPCFTPFPMTPWSVLSFPLRIAVRELLGVPAIRLEFGLKLKTNEKSGKRASHGHFLCLSLLIRIPRNGLPCPLFLTLGSFCLLNAVGCPKTMRTIFPFPTLPRPKVPGW